MSAGEIIGFLQSLGQEKNRIGMARFGINTEKAFGISMKELHPLAKSIKKNHELALELWDSQWHEAMILAVLIDDPQKLTIEQMNKWANDFNSWDVCDQATMKLFGKSSLAFWAIDEWYSREEEFIKRASFSLMATLSLHHKPKNNEPFLKFLKMIEADPTDERNFVKKAVNWALRQIGKRNLFLRENAIDSCNRILELYPNSKSARWIVKDALREFDDEKIFERTKKSRHN